jgi:hypothetical protein
MESLAAASPSTCSTTACTTRSSSSSPPLRCVRVLICSLFYECSLHHTKLPAYLTMMKKYHLAHHYKVCLFFIMLICTFESDPFFSPSRSSLLSELRARFRRHFEDLGHRLQHRAPHYQEMSDLSTLFSRLSSCLQRHDSPFISALLTYSRDALLHT